LQAEQHALVDAGLTAEDALDMLENMSDQLSALYEARDERTEALLSQIDALTDTLGAPPADAAAPQAALDHVLDAVGTASPAQSTGPADDSSDELAAIQRVLGISSVEEAKDLAAVAENMSEQLEALYDDRAQLQKIGVSSVESAVEMIQSMSTQLDELYEEQELLQGRPAPDELKEQDTFEQLAALYAEQEKLERALGVSEADAIIEMVEGLKDQLEAFSSDHDETSLSTASSSYSPTAVEDHTANGTQSNPEGPISLQRLKQTPVFTSMRDQLESLYEEKEALLNMGIDDVQTAAGRIDELEARLSTLQHKHEQCRDRMEHLRRELGTAKVEEIVDMVSPSMETPPSHGSTPPDAPHDSRPGEDVPTVLPQETLTDIDDRPEEDLDALSVGVLRLDDDGAIEYLNEAALALPGLDAESPRADLLDAFFFQAVPSTSNTLFLNRFRTGVDQEKMDVRFPYTFVSPQHPPTAFYVHLYRSGPSGANWIFLRPVR
jgi:photoactive yellow protein